MLNLIKRRSNTYRFAKQELDVLSQLDTDPENRPVIEEFRKEILELCDKFGKSGQSGGSAPMVATALSKAIKSLCLQEPICPVTGAEDEWVEVAFDDKKGAMFQNKRCSGVFKYGKDGKAYYVDAIIWKTQKGFTYHSKSVISRDTGSILSSLQIIKKFPFEPKTFYINVVEEEPKPEWFEFYLEDKAQMDIVWEIYEKPEKL